MFILSPWPLSNLTPPPQWGPPPHPSLPGSCRVTDGLTAAQPRGSLLFSPSTAQVPQLMRLLTPSSFRFFTWTYLVGMFSSSNRCVLSTCHRRGALWDALWDAGERFQGDVAPLTAPSQSAFLNPRAQNSESSKVPTADSCFISTLTPFVILASIHTLRMLVTPECLPIPWISRQKFKLFQPNCLLSSSKQPRGFQMNKSKNLLPSFNLYLPQSYPGRFNSSSCWGQTIWSQP